MKNDKKTSPVICCDDVKAVIKQPIIDYISSEAPKNDLSNGKLLQINLYENNGKQGVFYFTDTGRIEKAILSDIPKPITLPVYVSEIKLAFGSELNIPSYIVMGYKGLIENCIK